MPLDRGSLMLRYAGFALLSTAINCLVQFFILHTLAGSLAIYIALAFGTGAGFVSKFLLDRNYVFYHVSSGYKQEVWVSICYLGTSVIMTLAYLSFQTFVYFEYGDGAFYYISACLVLCLGYSAKFLIDGRFVFTSGPQRGAPVARGRLSRQLRSS
jgi:putative flippase GtrA